jgi:hypothetical protein
MGFWLKSILTEGDKQKKLNRGAIAFLNYIVLFCPIPLYPLEMALFVRLYLLC